MAAPFDLSSVATLAKGDMSPTGSTTHGKRPKLRMPQVFFEQNEKNVSRDAGELRIGARNQNSPKEVK